MFVKCGGVGDFSNGRHLNGDDRRHQQEDSTRDYDSNNRECYLLSQVASEPMTI